MLLWDNPSGWAVSETDQPNQCQQLCHIQSQLNHLFPILMLTLTSPTCPRELISCHVIAQNEQLYLIEWLSSPQYFSIKWVQTNCCNFPLLILLWAIKLLLNTMQDKHKPPKAEQISLPKLTGNAFPSEEKGKRENFAYWQLFLFTREGPWGSTW